MAASNSTKSTNWTDITAQHAAAIETLRVSDERLEKKVDVLSNDVGDLKVGIKQVLTELRATQAQSEYRRKSFDLTTVYSSVGIIAILGAALWAVFQMGQSDAKHYEELYMQERMSKVDARFEHKKSLIDDLEERFEEHCLLDGHPKAISMHTRTNEKMNGFQKELTVYRQEQQKEIDQLRSEMELKIKARDGRFDDNDYERLVKPILDRLNRLEQKAESNHG